MKKLLALPLLLLPLACKKSAAVAKNVAESAQAAAKGDTAPAQAVKAMQEDMKKARSAVDQTLTSTCFARACLAMLASDSWQMWNSAVA